MTPKEKAKELVKQHFFAINGDYEHIKTNGEDWMKAVRGALICAENEWNAQHKILSHLQKHLSVSVLIQAITKIDEEFEEVKQEINKL